MRRKISGIGRESGFTLLELMVVVAIIGVIAAVAIPSLRSYIRRSKAAEVQKNLEWCFQGVVNFYLATHWMEDPGDPSRKIKYTNQLPGPSMNDPLCPQGIADPKDLDGSLRAIDATAYGPGKIGETFNRAGFVVTAPTHACYQYQTTNLTPVDVADFFTCTAFTDLDNDDLVSNWVKTGTFDPLQNAFGTGAVVHEAELAVPVGDDW